MQTVKNAISGILIKAALSAANKSTQKQRIMTLWERGIIPADLVENLIQAHGLKGE